MPHSKVICISGYVSSVDDYRVGFVVVESFHNANENAIESFSSRKKPIEFEVNFSSPIFQSS